MEELIKNHAVALSFGIVAGIITTMLWDNTLLSSISVIVAAYVGNKLD